MPVAARVVADLIGAASLAAQDVSTQRRAAALFDGRHDLELTQAQVAALRGSPSGTVRTEDVGDLQVRPPHVGGLKKEARPPAGRSPLAADRWPHGRRSLWSPTSC